MSDEANTPAQGNFDALLAEIGTDLSKALPKDPKDGETAEDDKNIAEAAADCDENPHAKDDDEAPGEMKKSFSITLEDGTIVEAVDGADLIKSFSERIERNESAVLKVVGDAVKVISAQGELIKALQTKVDTLGNEGRGRKVVVSVAEKPAATAETLAKSDTPAGVTPEEFMAKALTAQAAGKLTSVQVAEAESYLNLRQRPPEHIVRAVMGDA